MTDELERLSCAIGAAEVRHEFEAWGVTPMPSEYELRQAAKKRRMLFDKLALACLREVLTMVPKGVTSRVIEDIIAQGEQTDDG